MSTVAKARIGNIYLVQLEPDADLLLSIREAIRENNIETGVILDITGGLTRARVQKFKEVGPPLLGVHIVDIPGPMEVSGHGIIGLTRGSGGPAGHKDGQPYVHCHITMTSGEQTLCGHLMEGSYVRSRPGKSHFTIVLAAFEGARLTLVVPPKAADGPAANVYHELEQL